MIIAFRVTTKNLPWLSKGKVQGLGASDVDLTPKKEERK